MCCQALGFPGARRAAAVMAQEVHGEPAAPAAACLFSVSPRTRSPSPQSCEVFASDATTHGQGGRPSSHPYLSPFRTSPSLLWPQSESAWSCPSASRAFSRCGWESALWRCLSEKPPELVFLCAWSDVAGSRCVRGRFGSPPRRGPACPLSPHRRAGSSARLGAPAAQAASLLPGGLRLTLGMAQVPSRWRSPHMPSALAPAEPNTGCAAWRNVAGDWKRHLARLAALLHCGPAGLFFCIRPVSKVSRN